MERERAREWRCGSTLRRGGLPKSGTGQGGEGIVFGVETFRRTRLAGCRL